tara:strand:- start:242 stop:721 length:480 start_codon:yes stop_codon:yes gene_type:complete
MEAQEERDIKFSEWKSLTGTKLTMDEFKDFCNENCSEIFVGTDSQVRGQFTKFTVVVAAYEEGKGGKVIARSAKIANYPDLRTRLLQETWFSIELALELSKELDHVITIHCDVNADPTYKSGLYAKEVQGYVKGFGFDCEIKPSAWCASNCADRNTKSG